MNLASNIPISASADESSEESPEKIIKKISDYIEEFNQKDILKSEYKKLVFVVGNSGTGKSTLVNFLAGDDLVAKKINGKLIIDNNTPSDIEIGHGLESKTFFPQFKNISGTVYCDMPGFGDTRGIVEEIAKAIFMKKIADYVDEVKILVTIAYSDIDTRAEGLRSLVKHLSDFIGNINVFDNGVDIVVTKVENSTKIENGNYVSKTDEEIIEEIFVTLNSFTKETLDESSFLDSVISQKRLKIFRQPSGEGTLKELELPQLGRIFEIEQKNIQNTIENTLYLSKAKVDFGYSITSDAKLDSIGIAQKLKAKMVADMNAIFAAIENHYSNQVKSATDIYELKKFLDAQNWNKKQFDLGKSTLFLKEISQKINKLRISISSVKFKEFLAKNEFLYFLQSISNNKVEKYNNYQALDSFLTFFRKEENFSQALINLVDIKLTGDSLTENSAIKNFMS